MSLFNRKETVVFRTEQLRDAYIARLDAAHIKYEVRDSILIRDVDYTIRVAASELKKIR